MAIWQAKLNTFWEMVVTQVISGLSGAVSETLVQITVSKSTWLSGKLKVNARKVVDMFFIHQRGTMNGIYLMMVAIGVCSRSFIADIPADFGRRSSPL
jgi:hypothetical protein